MIDLISKLDMKYYKETELWEIWKKRNLGPNASEQEIIRQKIVFFKNLRSYKYLEHIKRKKTNLELMRKKSLAGASSPVYFDPLTGTTTVLKPVLKSKSASPQPNKQPFAQFSQKNLNLLEWA